MKNSITIKINKSDKWKANPFAVAWKKKNEKNFIRMMWNKIIESK